MLSLIHHSLLRSNLSSVAVEDSWERWMQRPGEWRVAEREGRTKQEVRAWVVQSHTASWDRKETVNSYVIIQSNERRSCLNNMLGYDVLCVCVCLRTFMCIPVSA